MPILTNIRHELFAQAIAKGATDVDAYEQAGYKPDVRNAHNLTKNNSVAARIKELERENRELKKANEILRLASAFFAQAELDRRFKL